MPVVRHLLKASAILILTSALVTGCGKKPAPSAAAAPEAAPAPPPPAAVFQPLPAKRPPTPQQPITADAGMTANPGEWLPPLKLTPEIGGDAKYSLDQDPARCLDRKTVEQLVATAVPNKQFTVGRQVMTAGPFEVRQLYINAAPPRKILIFEVVPPFAAGLTIGESRSPNSLVDVVVHHVLLKDGRDAIQRHVGEKDVVVPLTLEHFGYPNSRAGLYLYPKAPLADLDKASLTLRVRYPYDIKAYRLPCAKLPAFLKLASGTLRVYPEPPNGFKYEVEAIPERLLGARAYDSKGQHISYPNTLCRPNRGITTYTYKYDAPPDSIVFYEYGGTIEKTYDLAIAFACKHVEFTDVKQGAKATGDFGAEILSINDRVNDPGRKSVFIALRDIPVGADGLPLEAFAADGTPLEVYRGGQIKRVDGVPHVEYVIKGDAARLLITSVISTSADEPQP